MGIEDDQRAPLIKNSTHNKQKDNERYEYDPSFKGVKETGRTCNDILFAILFVLVLIGMGLIATLGFIKGDPSRLTPSNEWNNEVSKADCWFQDAVAVMKRDVDVIAGAVGVAFVLAVLWIQLMKYLTKLNPPTVTVILGFLAIIALGVYCLTLGIHKESASLKYSSYGLFGIAAIVLLILVLLRKKIALTAALFAECCRGFQYNPGMLLAGIVVFVVMAAFMAFWIAQFIYLYSIPGETVQIPDAPPKFNEKIRNLMYFQVFAYFWVTAFLSAVFQVAVAGGMATWYFSRDLDGHRANAGSPSFRSLGRAVTYSFGSLAIGSLLLAVVQFINFVLTVARKANFKNRIAVFIISCIQCMLNCVQGIMKFINKFAYIYIAMHGEGFFSSAKNVMNLISRNMFTTMVVDLLGEFVLLVGKLLGTCICTLFTVGLCNHLGREISPVTVTVTAFMAFRIFSLFAKIIHVGVDTITVCYLEDLERNKDGALYMSPELHKLLQDKASDSNSKRINN